MTEVSFTIKFTSPEGDIEFWAQLAKGLCNNQWGQTPLIIAYKLARVGFIWRLRCEAFRIKKPGIHNRA